MKIDLTNADSSMAQLVDSWCARRALQPLRVILSCYPRASGLNDEWGALAVAFKTIRAQFGASLPSQELEHVIALQHFAESIVYGEHAA